MKGKELYKLRSEAGLTQRECAEAVGVKIQTWSHWELGNSSIRLSRENQIRKFFDGQPKVNRNLPTLKSFLDNNVLNKSQWGEKYGFSKQRLWSYEKSGYLIDAKAKQLILPSVGRRIDLKVVK